MTSSGPRYYTVLLVAYKLSVPLRRLGCSANMAAIHEKAEIHVTVCRSLRLRPWTESIIRRLIEGDETRE